MKAKFALKVIAALYLTAMLAGCAQSAKIAAVQAGINLPPMPVDLTTPCYDPSVKSGDDAGNVIARHRKALAICRARHFDTVKFYGSVVREYAY